PRLSRGLARTFARAFRLRPGQSRQRLGVVHRAAHRATAWRRVAVVEPDRRRRARGVDFAGSDLAPPTKPRNPPTVIPAKAGTHFDLCFHRLGRGRLVSVAWRGRNAARPERISARSKWVPAFAGMTANGDSRFVGRPSAGLGFARGRAGSE